MSNILQLYRKASIIKNMRRSLSVLVFFVFAYFLTTSLRPIFAYWTKVEDIQENTLGSVLGWRSTNGDINYYYIAGPAPIIPTSTPSPTTDMRWRNQHDGSNNNNPNPTNTPIPTGASSPTNTPTPTSGRREEHNNNFGNSSSSNPTNTPRPQQHADSPTITPPVTGQSGSGGSNWQGIAPTPTIIYIQPSPIQTSSPTISPSSRPSSNESFVTGTPYPTRPGGLSVITTPGINMPSMNDLINPPTPPSDLVGPTPIPDELKGGIFIVPTPAPNKTTAVVPGQPEKSPIFVPGHTIASIDIKTPPKETNTGSTSSGIDIQVNKTDGSGINANEEQFIIQKAMQRITISADTTQTNSLSLSKNDVRARISMGIQIDPLTNTLTVDTPNGKQRVSIMPDDALNIIRELKLIEKNILPDNIVLESHNGQLSYKIPASKIQKILGLIPLSIPKDIFIAADTGGIVEIQTSAFYNFVTLFTF